MISQAWTLQLHLWCHTSPIRLCHFPMRSSWFPAEQCSSSTAASATRLDEMNTNRAEWQFCKEMPLHIQAPWCIDGFSVRRTSFLSDGLLSFWSQLSQEQKRPSFSLGLFAKREEMHQYYMTAVHQLEKKSVGTTDTQPLKPFLLQDSDGTVNRHALLGRPNLGLPRQSSFQPKSE